MIVIRYTGGLGNQMFEYAMSTILEERFPDKNIYADLSRYDLTEEHNGFELEKYFEVHIEKASDHILKRVAPIHYFLYKIGMKQLLKRLPVLKVEKVNGYLEKKDSQIGVIKDLDSTNYNENAFELNLGTVILWHYKGNWINPLYWKGYEAEVIRKFQFKTQLLTEQDRQILKRITECESVAIHIRKGDYVGDCRFELCGDRYYLSAIRYIESVLKEKELYFFIFSEEDIVELLCGKKNCIKISHSKDCGIDLYMMSKCKHNIIANSTFSYWSAILNTNKDKIVVSPKYMYRDKAVLRKLPVPDGWKVIDNFNG